MQYFFRHSLRIYMGRRREEISFKFSFPLDAFTLVFSGVLLREGDNPLVSSMLSRPLDRYWESSIPFGGESLSMHATCCLLFALHAFWLLCAEAKLACGFLPCIWYVMRIHSAQRCHMPLPVCRFPGVIHLPTWCALRAEHGSDHTLLWKYRVGKLCYRIFRKRWHITVRLVVSVIKHAASFDARFF